MGLDMYLYTNSKPLTDKVHEDEPYGEYITESYKRSGIVLYWRKSNAIHQWFVDKVQGGRDDCGTYAVDTDDLIALKGICDRIVAECQLVDGKVRNGQRFVNDSWQDIIEDGKVMTNTELAEEILPTKSGFFFGCTDYDQWYYNDAKRTAEELGRIFDMLETRTTKWGWVYPVMPEEPDWEVMFYYHSSW